MQKIPSKKEVERQVKYKRGYKRDISYGKEKMGDCDMQKRSTEINIQTYSNQSARKNGITEYKQGKGLIQLTRKTET